MNFNPISMYLTRRYDFCYIPLAKKKGALRHLFLFLLYFFDPIEDHLYRLIEVYI